MPYFFYVRDSCCDGEIAPLISKSRYTFNLWRPNIFSIVPSGFPNLPFAVWWVMHWLHVFANREYSIFAIYNGTALVHRSCIFPRYPRFPFMGADDLQIGDTWTLPEYRRKGLAVFAIQSILMLHRKQDRKFWYVVEAENLPSIWTVERAGFTKVGEGFRTKRFGVKAWGSFVIQ